MAVKPDIDHLIVETHTMVKMMKEEYNRRLGNLEDEDKVLHHRINVIRNLFTGIFAAINTGWAGFVIYLKLKFTGG